MKISIIIPTHNEAGRIAATLEAVQRQRLSPTLAFEVLVVDCGSTDGTLTAAQKFFADDDKTEVRGFLSEKGRAKQFNCGAYFAAGDVLLFLHADTLLSDNALLEIEKALSDEKALNGYFYMKFDHSHPLATIYSDFTKLNLPLLHYGDAGLFVRKATFDKLGGYADLEIAEDLDINLRLAKLAEPKLITSAFVTTSARRFERHGFFALQAVNAAVVALFLVGVESKTLRQIYNTALKQLE
jgi:rSAM/selenodomain-associated transferase 2